MLLSPETQQNTLPRTVNLLKLRPAGFLGKNKLVFYFFKPLSQSRTPAEKSSPSTLNEAPHTHYVSPKVSLISGTNNGDGSKLRSKIQTASLKKPNSE